MLEIKIPGNVLRVRKLNLQFDMRDQERGSDNVAWVAADVYTKYNTYRTRVAVAVRKSENQSITYDLDNCEQGSRGEEYDTPK